MVSAAGADGLTSRFPPRPGLAAALALGCRRWSMADLVEGVEDLLGFGAAGVVGVDVDPPHGVAGVEDDGGGHRQHDGAVGVDSGQVQSQLELGGSGLRGRLGEDAEPAGGDITGVGDHREGQVVLLLHGQRPVRLLGTDRDQPDTAFGQLREQVRLIGGQGDAAVRAPRTAVEDQYRRTAAGDGVQSGGCRVRVEQTGVGQDGPGSGQRRQAPGGQFGLFAAERSRDLVSRRGCSGRLHGCDAVGDGRWTGHSRLPGADCGPSLARHGFLYLYERPF